MAEQKEKSAYLSDRALEMIMRDVLDGLEEWSLESALGGCHPEFEIIDIQPARAQRQALNPSPEPLAADNKAEIFPFPQKNRAHG